MLNLPLAPPPMAALGGGRVKNTFNVVYDWPPMTSFTSLHDYESLGRYNDIHFLKGF